MSKQKKNAKEPRRIRENWREQKMKKKEKKLGILKTNFAAMSEANR